MDGELDLLLSVAGGLGRWQDVDDFKRIYIKDDDCLACLKDLQRFLRRDEPDTREVFFKLGQLQLVQNDIMPLITTFPTDKDLVYHALKVLTFMTVPVDDMTAQVPKQYTILADIKRVCLSKDILAALMSLSAGPLSRHPKMSEEDHQTLQLLLTFFRNLVSIPDPPVAAGTAAAAAAQNSMQDTLLEHMFAESVMELVLLVAGHCDERPFRDDAALLLDLLAEMYQGIDVQEVLDITQEAVDQQQRQQQQRQQQQRAAAAARQASRQKPRSVAQQILASKQLTRHGRFKSTIVQTHTDTAANTYIHDASKLHNLQAPQIELDTRVRGPPPQKWSPAVLLAVKNYTNSLLKGGYNVLMGQLRREVEAGLGISRLEAGDFTKWFSLAAWVSGYVRRQQESLYEAKRQQKQPQQSNGSPAPAAAAAAADDVAGEAAAAAAAASPFGGISATLGWDTFQLTQKTYLAQADLPQRSPDKDWSLLHASSLLLREALGLLELAAKAGSDMDKKTANRLARKLLYDDTTDAGLLATLSRRIKTFSARHEPRSAAATLVEALHVVLRLYDRLQAQEDGVFLVRAKKRSGGRGGGRRKKLTTPEPEGQQQQQEQEEDPDKEQKEGDKEQQQQQGEGNGQADKGDDAAAVNTEGSQQQQQQQQGEKDTGEQSVDGGNGSNAEKAAAAAAAATDEIAADVTHEPVTSEHITAPAAAAAGSSPEKHKGAESPLAESAGSAGANSAPAKPQQQQQQPHRVADDSDDESKGSAAAAAAGGGAAAKGAVRRNVLEELEAEGGSDDDDDEDDERQAPRHREIALDLRARLRKEMAVPAVVHFYSWMLAGYNSGNSPGLNHAVVSFLWRLILPEHLNLEPLLYQLSVLRLFHQLLSDASLRGKQEHTNMLRLATKVVRGLFDKLAPPPPPVDADTDTPAAAAAAAGHDGDPERQQQQQEEADAEQQQRCREREQRRQAAVAGMVAVELMFWKHPNTAELIRDEFYLREEDMVLVDGVGGKSKRKDPAALGDDGLPAPRTLAPLLNPAGEAKLKTFFEQLCADRNNLEQITQQMGGKLSAIHIKRELTRLGLKFGALPDSLKQQLHQLWQQHRDEGLAAAVDKIAQELPGGWNSKQVRKLLRNEELLASGRGGGGGGRLGNRRRRGAGNADDEGFFSDGDGWASADGETGDVLFDVEKPELERLYQQYIVEEDYLNKIAAALPFDAAAADVLATLRFYGIVSKPKAAKKTTAAAAGGSRRRAAAGAAADGRKVTKAMLVDLCDQHGGDADGLNIIAMSLGLPVIEVQKLLVKHNISLEGDSEPDSHSSQANRRCPISNESLKQLYDDLKDTAPAGQDYLESIAEQLPIPATAEQVKAWLKKAGVLKPVARKRRERGEDGQVAGRPAAAAAAVERRVGGGSVAEPQLMQLLGYLEALHRSHADSSNSYLDGPGAVSWLLGKFDAAESVWQLAAAAAAAGGTLADYALVPSGQDDLDFFCADWSNELLVAAGVRNDNDDYFKIPGNSTAAWRDRVRAALREALAKLGSSEAAAACDAVMEEARAATQADRAAAEAAAADEEARRVAAAQGLGFGGSGSSQRPRGKAAAAAAAGGKKAAGRRQSSAAAAAAAAGSGKRGRRKAAAESSDDGWDSDDGQQQQQRYDGGGSSSSSESEQDDDMPRFEDDDDGSDQDHDGDASPAAAVGGSGKKRQQAPVHQNSRKRASAAAAAVSSDVGSDADGVDADSASDDDEEAPVAKKPVHRNSTKPAAAAAAAAAGGSSRKRRSTSADPTAAAAGVGKKRKSGADSPGGGAAARRTALQEITRKRQQQQPATAGKLQQQQQQQHMMLVNDDDDDDDDDLADDGFEDAENRVAPAAAAAVVGKVAAAAAGRAGRAAMVLLDDDDDDD